MSYNYGQQQQPDPYAPYYQQVQRELGQQPPPMTPGYYGAPPGSPRPRRRRHVFVWVFLAIQVLFVAWIIAGVAGESHGMNQGVTAADTAQAQQTCGNGAWQYLSPADTLSGANTAKSSTPYASEAVCVTDQARDQAALGRGATTAGTAIGVAVIVALWVAVDVIAGISYGIYRLATRPRS
jgi:hypothetical protein